MHSRNYAWTLGVVLAIGVVLGIGVVDLSAQMNDPRIGTWKLDAAKSKYSPGPAPQSLMVKVEAAGQGEKTTTDFVNTDGTRVTTQYTANFDGKDSPLTGSQFGADMVSLKRIDARTTERTDKKGRQGCSGPHAGRLSGREDDDRHDEGHERPGSGSEQRRSVREAIRKLVWRCPRPQHWR